MMLLLGPSLRFVVSDEFGFITIDDWSIDAECELDSSNTTNTASLLLSSMALYQPGDAHDYSHAIQ